MVYSYTLHWGACGPPPQPRLHAAPTHLSADDAAAGQLLIDQLRAGGVVSELPAAARHDPTSVFFVSNVFVVYRTKPLVQAAEEAAVEDADVNALRGLATARAAEVLRRAQLHLAAYPAALPAERFAYATSWLRDNASRKARLVVDLRDLNEYIAKLPFTMASGWDVVRSWRHATYWVAIDIKGGFYHVRIARALRRYLCFEFNGRIYRFNRLPMGLRSAPAVFCALSAELTRMLRRLGLNVVVTYIDDLVLAAATEEEGRRALAIIRALFVKLNIAMAEDKVRGPATSMVALGLSLRSGASSGSSDFVTVPGTTLFATLIDVAIVRALLDAPQPQLRQVHGHFLQRLAGRLVWVATTIFAGHTMMRALWMLLYHAPAEDGAMISLTGLEQRQRQALRSTLQWWLTDQLVKPQRVMRLSADALAADHTATLFTDASEATHGGYATLGFLRARLAWPSTVLWGRMPTDGGSLPSSMWRELRSIIGTLIARGPALTGRLVVIRTDNWATAYAINKAKADKDSCHRLALCMRRIAWAFSLEYIALWLAREGLILPDLVSKCPSHDAAIVSVREYATARSLPPPAVDRIPDFVVQPGSDGRVRVTEPRPAGEPHNHWWDAFPGRDVLFA
jgi:hypothetical protein